MSNFNLDQAEVVEMNAVDMNQVDGGNPFLIGIIVGLLLARK